MSIKTCIPSINGFLIRILDSNDFEGHGFRGTPNSDTYTIAEIIKMSEIYVTGSSNITDNVRSTYKKGHIIAIKLGTGIEITVDAETLKLINLSDILAKVDVE